MAHTLAEKLRQLREKRGYTQQQIADKMDVTRATVSNWENGRRSPDINVLRFLSDLYGVGLDYFDGSNDSLFDLLMRAKNIFDNPNISEKEKDDLHKQLLKLYLVGRNENDK